MVKAFNKIKKDSLVSLFFIVFSFGFLHAQEQKTMPDIEKIYLHTDKSRYFIGEDLWYKAYTVRASNNLLFDNSNILYVELISPDSRIVARNKTNIEIGLGRGDFQLTDSLGVKPGVYQLRAYTNWNRNFGDDFVFKKNIEIIDVFESRTKTNPAQNSANAAANQISEIGNPTSYRVDFFPEGGSLLENVASIVGFKAVDTNGNPIHITGEIFDSNDELVTTFSSPHDGMGKFQMIPMEGKNYYAKIKTPDGKVQRVELPKVANQGYLLSFRTFKGKNIVSLLTNEKTLLQNPNAALTVVCRAKGVSYFESTQTLNQTTFSFELAKDKTPEGISQITLFDSNSKPQSERLVYIEKEHDLEVQLSTDKASYKPNEKATVNVSSKSKTGVTKSASFSLSVTDMNGVLKENDFGTNISSYFLMESDIRGKVHNPGYYFDATNLKRLEHLDNLLLTQGWRDFLWKKMAAVDEKNSYKVEKGITISGSVKHINTDKLLENNNLTLSLMGNKNNGIFNATTNSVGYFQFAPLLFDGKKIMYLSTRDEKGKFNGKIVLDSIEHSPMRISFKNELINWDESLRKIVGNVFKKYGYLDLKSENILEEVAIKAKEKDRSFTNRTFINNTVVKETPAFIYLADKDLYISSFTSIFDFILKKIPNLKAFGNSVSFLRYEHPPIFWLNPKFDNNDEVSVEQLASISPSDVEHILAIEIEDVQGKGNPKGIPPELLHFTKGEKAPYGIILIWTKPFTGNQRTKNPLSSINKRIEGFNTARVFYSPNPEKPNSDLDDKLDVRNTIYWNPEVCPDKAGTASVSYHNTKVETKVKVALEGITGGGIPVIKHVYYDIKK